MKKILTLGAAALVLIALSGCQFNLFTEFDKIEIPGVADLDAKAASDESGFVSDIEDYMDNNFLENDAVTDEQVAAIVTNLETIYTTPPDVTTGQQAAVLAGEIIIASDPVTASVVDGVIGSVTDALSAGGTIDPDTLVGSIFPPDLDQAGLTSILDNLDQAATAYADFAGTVSGSGTADWMSSAEAGDVVQLAVVSLVVADLRAQLIVSEGSAAAADAALLDTITNGTPLPAVNDPFDSASGSTYATELADLLTFAALDLGV